MVKHRCTPLPPVNTQSRTLRPLLAVCLFLAGSLPSHAENWQTFSISAPPARSGHGFLLQRNGQPYGSVSNLGFSDYWMTGTGGSWVSPHTKLTLTLDAELSGSLTLLDTTSGDLATMPLSYGDYNYGQEGGGTGWMLGSVGENDFYALAGTPPVRWFFIPAERQSDALVLCQPGVTIPLSVWSSGLTYNDGHYTGYAGYATFDPNQPFRIADLTTGEQAPLFATDLASAQWTPGAGDLPLVSATLYLEGREDGHRFAVHSRAPGGPVIVQSVAALGGVGGEWIYDAAWNYFQVPADSATLCFAVGRGMEFWITRDADSPPVSSPLFAADDSSGGPLVWLLHGVFSATPQRSTEARTFRIHAQRWGHEFTVWQSDGYHFRFAAIPPTLDWPGQIYSAGTISNWNEQGLFNPLEVLTFTAPLDPTRTWWVCDDSDPSHYSYPAIPALQSEVLDGWMPQHTAPPAEPMVSIRLPWALAGAPFRLSGPGGEIGTDTGSGGRSPGTETLPGSDGMAAFALTSFTLSFTNPTPYVQNGFVLEDVTDGSNPTAYTVTGGANDLRLHARPPQPLLLDVSSSRWDHELLIRHPEGTTFAVQKGQMQGDVISDSQQNASPTSYYYFDAIASANPELPWYLEDASTSERLGPNPTNAELINWFALAAPKNLTATENPDGTFALSWTFEETSTEGAFQIERRAIDSPTWQLMDTIPAATCLDVNTQTARIPSLVFASAKAQEVRVYYQYGNRRSASSNTATLYTDDTDTDGDGLPDAWERQHGLTPTNPADANLDDDGDGLTNAEEHLLRTNPKKKDTDDDGLNDKEDHYPTDPFRSQDLPVTHYAAIDLSTPIVGPKEIWDVSIDDAGKVAFVWTDTANERYEVVVTNTSGAAPVKKHMPYHATFDHVMTVTPADGDGNPYQMMAIVDQWFSSTEVNTQGHLAGSIGVTFNFYGFDPAHPVTRDNLPPGPPHITYYGQFPWLWKGDEMPEKVLVTGPVFGFVDKLQGTASGVTNADIPWGWLWEPGGSWLGGFVGESRFPSVPGGNPRFLHDVSQQAVSDSGRAFGSKVIHVDGQADVGQRVLWQNGFVPIVGDDNARGVSVSDAGEVLGLSDHLSAAAWFPHLFPAALHAFFYTGGSLEDFYFSLPEVNRQQVFFTDHGDAEAYNGPEAFFNSQGDVVFHAANRAGTDRDPSWEYRATLLLERQSGGTANRLRQIILPCALRTVPYGRMNNDLLMVGREHNPQLNANGQPIPGAYTPWHAVLLLPVDITVRKKSEADAPPTGLLVKKGEVITFDINGPAPASDFPLPANTVKWKTRQLKHDGTLTDWADVLGEGSEVDFTTNTNGVFQAKAVLTVAGGQPQDLSLTRKKDAPHADNKDGEVQDFHKKGAEDYFGVADADWQISLRDAALADLGSTKYKNQGTCQVTALVTAPNPSNKCNIFVYHKGGAMIPLTRNTYLGVSFNPPLAIDWWNENTGRRDDAGRVINSVPIPNWARLPDGTMPEPGLVPAHPYLNGEPDQYSSHVGIFDYDGSWISAGFAKVNKYYHPKTVLRGATPADDVPFQPQGYRRYSGGN